MMMSRERKKRENGKKKKEKLAPSYWIFPNLELI